MKKRFRFQDMAIWKKAIDIAIHLHRTAEALEGKKLFRYAEQLRGAALSVSNNIAEGAGSSSNKEFAQFLNIAKRSCFELANMAIFLHALGHMAEAESEAMLESLDHECRMLESFRRNLRVA